MLFFNINIYKYHQKSNPVYFGISFEYDLYMANQYKKNPTWCELKLSTGNLDDIGQISHEHELILDPRTYTVYFFGNSVTLKAQEYKFLRAILTKKGERVSASFLMKQIKSKCKIELRQNLSYRVKSKIKAKLKQISTELIPLDDNNWVLVDQNYEQNRKDTTINGQFIYYQTFDFEHYFDMLISVKDKYYYTDFRPA